MNRPLLFVYGFVIGAVGGVLFAPYSGRRTRGLIKDKAVGYSRGVSDFTTAEARLLADRTREYAQGISKAISCVCTEEEEVKAHI